MPLLNIPQHSDSYIGEREEEEERGEGREGGRGGEGREGRGRRRGESKEYMERYQVKVDGFSWKREMSNTTKHS